MNTPSTRIAKKRAAALASVYLFAVALTASAQAKQPAADASQTSGDRPSAAAQIVSPAADSGLPADFKPAAGNANSGTDSQGRSYKRLGTGRWTNYDESRASPYALPDPLVLKDGRLVADARTWWNQRRPEILEDFQREMYGRIPTQTPAITWEIVSTAPAAGGAAIRKNIVGHIDNFRYPNASPSINITLYTPANPRGPVPVIMTLIAGPGGYGAPRAGAGAARTPAGEPDPPAGSAMYQDLKIGWGYATLEVGPIQNDYAGGLTSGIIGLMSEGKPRKPDDWGALSAWAWGASRAVDYFETDKSVDAKRLGVEGHSRYGKAALLAAALDQRWAIAYPSCSGEGGAKPSRRNWGETVDNISGSHWMAANFHKYAGHWNNLAVDSDELLALVAPRPIFLNGGTGDQWADPHGAFLAAVAAGPVYRLLGKNDLGSTQMPQPDGSLLSGDIGFRYHVGGHTDALDWPTFLQFAGKYFNSPPAAALAADARLAADTQQPLPPAQQPLSTPALPSAAAHYTLNPSLPTLWIVGASAVRNGHDTGNNGQWGWGNPLPYFFDRTRLNVVDFALGGTSTRTYQSLGLWDHALADMKPGDFVLIQFGSNDSSPVNDAARARGTLPGNGEETQEIDNLLTGKHEVVHTFGWYIRKFITDSKARGAACEIVLSPTVKNSWKDGKVARSANFVAWDTAAAVQEKVPFIDANAMIADKYDAAGQDKVTQTYFPDGETDHTDWAGAILNARCIADGIGQLPQCNLKDYLLANQPADIPLPGGKAR